MVATMYMHVCKDLHRSIIDNSEIIELTDEKIFTYIMYRHQVQHYTNQLAKETNKYMQDLAHLPQPSTQSEQASNCCSKVYTI